MLEQIETSKNYLVVSDFWIKTNCSLSAVENNAARLLDLCPSKMEILWLETHVDPMIKWKMIEFRSCLLLHVDKFSAPFSTCQLMQKKHGIRLLKWNKWRTKSLNVTKTNEHVNFPLRNQRGTAWGSVVSCGNKSRHFVWLEPMVTHWFDDYFNSTVH